VKVPLENLDPGACIETPAVFKALGWQSPTALYLGGDAVFPQFLLYHKGITSQAQWPTGPRGLPAPQEEFEIVEDQTLTNLRKAQLAKGWQTLHYNYVSGADPEFFAVDVAGEVIPATSFLSSKKCSFAVFYDGLQAEIAPPAGNCLEVFSSNIEYGLQSAHNLLIRKHRDARITLRNAFQLSAAQMRSLTEEDLAFRCSTSMNIYNDGGELPDPREYPWRFAGGHIHIGCGNRRAPVIRAMVRALDGILGVAAVSLARNWDTAERRRMYGRAGEFRLPKHGLEYRVLSNYWLCSPLIYHLTFELARYAYRIGESGAFDILYEGTEEEIRQCINRCDVGLALALIERNAPLYRRIFEQIWSRGQSAKVAMDTLRGGLEVAVPNPDRIMENWREGHGTTYPCTWYWRFQ
jgi:hypothetical protein